MAIIEETVKIKCPTDKVFAYVSDAKNWPKWNIALLEAEQTSSGPMRNGATFRGTNKVMGQRQPWTSKISEFEPNKGWKETISSGNTLIKEHLTFISTEEGTKFTQVYDMKLGGLFRLFAPMVTSMMQKQMKTNLNTLKNILETQA